MMVPYREAYDEYFQFMEDVLKDEHHLYNSDIKDSENYNAFAHAYLSARFTYDEGPTVAGILGFGRELQHLDNYNILFGTPGTAEYEDTLKDHFNNAAGRAIVAWAQGSGIPSEKVDHLIADALARGLLITARVGDSRVHGKLVGNIELPVYDGPSDSIASYLEIEMGLPPGSLNRGSHVGTLPLDYDPRVIPRYSSNRYPRAAPVGIDARDGLFLGL
jgi:hypothetical protein